LRPRQDPPAMHLKPNPPTVTPGCPPRPRRTRRPPHTDAHTDTECDRQPRPDRQTATRPWRLLQHLCDTASGRPRRPLREG
jgi:hypothetical protein